MRLESRLSLQQEVGWDRDTVRMARYLADVQSEPFVVTSLITIQDQLSNWVKIMPDIQPTFNVGSNLTGDVLTHLQHLDIPFTFNNKQEMSRMVNSGLDMSTAIFSNPVKLSSHLRAAQNQSVDILYCDSVMELNKIKKFHPTASILIQLNSDEQSSDLTDEGGANLSDVEEIIRQSDSLCLNIVGLVVNLADLTGVKKVIRCVRQVVDLASQIGCSLSQIHLQGLCPSGLSIRGVDQMTNHLTKLVTAVNLEELTNLGIEIYGDATEFLIGPSVTLAAKIVDVKEKIVGSDKVMCYVINESVFGAFSSNLATVGDTPVSAPLPLGGGKNRKGLTAKLLETNLEGNSGDQLDIVVEDVVLQRMELEDWLLFPSMGTANLTEYQTVRNMNGSHHILGVKIGSLSGGDSGARPCPDMSNVTSDKTVHIDISGPGVRAVDWELGETFINEGEDEE